MKRTSHRFKVGDPVQSLFADVPGDVLERVLREHLIGSDEIYVPYICLAADTGDGWVLVDTGLGVDEEHPEGGRLRAVLQDAGIEPGEIRIVILTHGHFDHIGGIIDDRGRPTYPNARMVMHRDEWDFWTSEETTREMWGEEVIPYLRARLTDLRERFDLIEGETEVVPGVRVVPAVGHTPGHLVVSIASAGERLLFISDLVAHPIQIERPEWAMVYDLDPEQAVATRRRVLEGAAADGVLVHGFHLRFPGLGHVVREGEALRWRPLE
jgi:glyoxylase-like metal-dependent hydrolase (beta-lactamase superfamily II)